MNLQIVLYLILQPSFRCQLKQMRSLLLYTVVQYVIVFLNIIIKQFDNFKDKAYAKNSF